MHAFTLSHSDLALVGASPLATTGTRLDMIVSILDVDRGLRAEIWRDEIEAGLQAANTLNGMIATAVAELGLAADGVIDIDDVVALNGWFTATAARRAQFLALHGDDDEDDEIETGYHLVQDDGARSAMFGDNLANTVADGIYHIGFAIADDHLLNEDGDENASLEDVAAWLDYFFGSFPATGTGLDDIVEVILADRGLSQWTCAADIMGGADAARQLNLLLLEGMDALGLRADGRISVEDIVALNGWINDPAHPERYARFVELHGDDESDESWGYHLVQNNGADSEFMGDNFLDTVADGIYHIGFRIQGDHVLNEDGNENADLGDLATWLNHLLLHKAIIEGSNEDSWWRGDDAAEAYFMRGGDDGIEAEGGNDSIDLGAGNDWAEAGSGDDVVEGGTGNDWFDGEEGRDRLLGGDGNDGMDGGDDADTIEGGAGDDQAWGGMGRDSLAGGDGRDWLAGQLDHDTLDGGAGNDEMWGGTGHDRMTGGLGNDKLWGNENNDTLSGDDGRDTMYGGTGADSLAGGDGNDNLSGNAGSDTVSGGEGNDTLCGCNGHDRVSGGAGADEVRGDLGNDDLAGDGEADRLYGEDGNDTAAGGEGNDSVAGNDGTDSLQGDAGNDSLDGGAQNDSLVGGDGNDVLLGSYGDDVLAGGDGADTLNGGNENDALHGGLGNDLLDGGNGHDALTGGLGSDVLRGGAGNDLLLSRGDDGEPAMADGTRAGPELTSPANDTFSGGSGADTFRFEVTLNATRAVAEAHLVGGKVDWAGLAAAESPATHARWLDGIGDDSITDFSSRSGDRIEIRGYGVAIDLRTGDFNADGVTDTRIHLYAGAVGGEALGSITVWKARLVLGQAYLAVDGTAAVGAYERPADAGYAAADAAFALPGWPDVI